MVDERKKRRNRGAFALIFVAVIILLLAGVLLAQWHMRLADREMRESLLQQARLVAQALNVDRINVLTGDPSDVNKPEYKRVKSQLAAVKTTESKYRFLYLMGRNETGELFFFVDNEPDGSEDCSPPGQIYEEATEAFRNIFDTETEAVQGPNVDRWGTWVSAFIPIHDPQTGKLTCVLGIDVDARTWRSEMIRALAPSVYFVLSLLVLLIMAVILFTRRSRTAEPPRWMFNLEPGTVFTAGFAVTLYLATIFAHQEQMARRNAFALTAITRTGAVLDTLRNLRNTRLTGLAEFFRGSENVTPAEFQRYTVHLLEDRDVQTWGWCQAVAAGDKARFEAEMRAAGFADFQIWQRDAQGNRIPAEGRNIYYPLVHLASTEDFPMSVGFDFGSEPMHAAAIETATQTTLNTATEPAPVSQEEPTQKRIFVYRPIFMGPGSGILRGLVFADIHMEGLLRRAFRDSSTLLEIRLQRETGVSESLASDWGAGPRPPSIPSPIHPVFAFGNVYIAKAYAGDSFLSLYPKRAGHLTIVAGLFFSALLAILVRLLLRRSTELERLVATRTVDLRESEEHLSATLRSIGDGVIACDREGRITNMNRVAETLTGWTNAEASGKRVQEIFRTIDSLSGSPAENVVDRALHEGTIVDLANHTALIARNGTHYHVADSCAPIRDTAGHIIGAVLVFRDVTEEYNHRAELAEERGRIEHILGITKTGIDVIDEQYNLRYVDPAWQKIYGDPTGRKCYEYFMGHDHPCATCGIPRALASKTPVVTEEVLPREGNRVVEVHTIPFLDAKGEWLVAEFNVDITERKRSAEALTVFRESLENATDAVGMSTPAGEHYYQNRSFTDLFGPLGQVSPEEIYVDSDVCKEVFATIKAGGRWTGEVQMRSRHGDVLSIHLRAYANKDENGNVTALVGLHTDMTERKRVEQEIQRNTERLRVLVEILQYPARNVQDFLDYALNKAIALTRSAIGYIYFYDEDKRQFILNTWSRDVMEECAIADPQTCYELDKTGFWGEAVRQRRPILNNDFEATHPLKKGYPDGHVRLTRFLTVPIFRGDQIIAVVGVANKPSDYDETDILELNLLMDTVWKSVETLKSEEALRASEAELRSLFSAPMVGMGLLKDRIFHKVNFGYCQMSGYAEEELLGKSLRMLYPTEEEYIATGRLLYDQMKQNGVGMCETRLQRKDGVILDTLIYVSPFDPSDMTAGSCFSALDITERRRIERELQKLAAVVQHTQEMVNLASLDGKMIFLNQAGCNMLGIDPQAVPQTHILDIVPEHLQTPVQQEVFPTLVKGGAWQGEVQYRNLQTGRLIDAYAMTFAVLDPATGVPQYLANVSLDITESKRQRESLLRTQFAMDRNSDSIVWIGEDGRLTYANDTACTSMGFTREELLQMTVFDIDPDFPRENWENHKVEMRRTGAVTFESRHRRKDGSTFSVEVTSNYFDFGGGFMACAFDRDITHRKQAEEERERLREQLAQAQKMESVGRLAGGVAHDFNNMLGVILGHTELALDGLKPTDPLYADLHEIAKAAQRSADLTRQLLAFARKQTVSPKVLDLNATVEGMLKMLRRLIGEDINLAWLPGKNVDPIKIDPSQLDQILANLCVNARDAIGETGRITIETGAADFEEVYCAEHPQVLPGEFAMLTVSDNGCGIPPELIDHLFEPFFTTKDVGKGTGLGLATVYGIVKQNNGFINVYSELGRGTTFKIYLPRFAEAPRTSGAGGAVETAFNGNETILVVEDEPAILKMATTMLGRHGYTVLPASSPNEALHLVSEYAGEIHLLITDVIMPEMNGSELARQLLTTRPSLKCLFMSGYTADAIAQHGVLDEGVMFIQKPFSKKDLAIKIREALETT